MKIVGVKLKNFRCYKEETFIHLDNLSCFIGKNDAGKSSIIEAVDIFFNGNADKGDLATDSDDNSIEITCYFDELPSKLILDTSIETCPKEECLLNKDGHLEIKRKYQVGKTITKSIYLKAYHPADERLVDILSKKNGPLKILASELGVDLEGVNKSKNPPLRKAIRNFVGGELSEIDIKVEGSLTTENNLKDIWGKIDKALPIFSIFKVDKPLDDKDKDVQDPMKVAIKEALAIADIQDSLEKISEKIKEQSTAVADRTLKKLEEIDANLAEKMRAEFGKQPAWDKVFDLTLLNDKDIPLNKRGSGIRRLVLLSFFRAQAEARKLEKNAPSIIYAIEEPETSQHPNHQKILIDSFKELSETKGVQVFFTTHSANLVREIPIKSLVYISEESDERTISYGFDFNTGDSNEQVIESIILTLGVLPDPNSSVQILLYLEGNNDVEAIKRYSEILFNGGKTSLNLMDNKTVGFVITGGSSLKFYVQKQYLKGLGKPEIHIYDNDVDDYRKYVDDINAENNSNRKAYNTTKMELENYLHHEAIEEAYAANSQIISISPITDNIDVPELVAKTVYEQSEGEKDWEQDLSDKEKGKKISKTKKFLNTQVVEKMTIERIVHRHGLDEIVHWLSELSSNTNSTASAAA